MLGRFQPLHNGHIKVMKDIVEEHGGLIVAIGSAQESHTFKNPFTAGERFCMIENAVEDMGMEDVVIIPVVDLNRYSLYVDYVKSLTPPFQAVVTHNPLTGRLFSEKDIDVISPGLHERDVCSGMHIRHRIVANESWQDLVPGAVVKVLESIDGAERLRSIAAGDAPADDNGSGKS